MTAAILDTNVAVQATISNRGASYRAVQALFASRYDLILSPATLNELTLVLALPHIRARNTWSNEEIRDYIQLLVTHAVVYPDGPRPPASISRDVTDTKFLALAGQSGADYLVTNDRRHLLPIGYYHHTRIATPNEFLKHLP